MPGAEPIEGAKQQRRKFTPEFRNEAIKVVTRQGRPVVEVARDIGVDERTLGNWVNVWRSEHAGGEPELGISERAELAQLRRDVATLRMEREFLKKSRGLLRERTDPVNRPERLRQLGC